MSVCEMKDAQGDCKLVEKGFEKVDKMDVQLSEKGLKLVCHKSSTSLVRLLGSVVSVSEIDKKKVGVVQEHTSVNEDKMITSIFTKNITKKSHQYSRRT